MSKDFALIKENYFVLFSKTSILGTWRVVSSFCVSKCRFQLRDDYVLMPLANVEGMRKEAYLVSHIKTMNNNKK